MCALLSSIGALWGEKTGHTHCPSKNCHNKFGPNWNCPKYFFALLRIALQLGNGPDMNCPGGNTALTGFASRRHKSGIITHMLDSLMRVKAASDIRQTAPSMTNTPALSSSVNMCYIMILMSLAFPPASGISSHSSHVILAVNGGHHKNVHSTLPPGGSWSNQC